MCKHTTRNSKITATLSALALLAALAATPTAWAGDAPIVGGLPAQPTQVCHAIQHVSDTPGDQGCCGGARLCPRPLAMTVIRAPRRIQHT